MAKEHSGPSAGNPPRSIPEAPHDIRGDRLAGSPGPRSDIPVATAAPAPTVRPVHADRPAHSRRLWILLIVGVVVLAIVARFAVPWMITALNTVSTDDAYVNGHVTFVAPRVAGQVMKVFVDDNYRVKKGDLLVQLDKEPYQVQVAIKQAAVTAAETDVAAAQAQVRALVAQTRANRYKLEHAIEDVNNQIANLRAAVATLASKKATLELARANFKRGEELAPTGGISKEDLDVRRQTVKVDEAAVDQALQNIYAIRASLGLPQEPPSGKDLSYVPPGYDQGFSTVRQALSELLQNAARFGYFATSWDAPPKQVLADFYKQSPQGNLDEIYAKLIPL